MTIQFLRAWNGYEQFSVHTLQSAEETRLIDAGLARAYTPGMDGQSLSLTSAQVAAVRESIPAASGTVPRGVSWLDDLIGGFDIYKQGFTRTPTIYFDPTATGSAGTGSYRNPYTTVAELQARCAGNMAGQTLGIKRGTTTRHSGFNIVAHGASGSPFTICPYGDAEALPIITSGAVITNWSLVDAGANIWSYAMGATEHDVWQNHIRLWKKAWSTSAVNTLTTAGTATFNSNTLYVRPYAGEDPRLGQMEVSTADNALLVQYSNVAASGFITICGLDLRKSRSSTLDVTYPGSTGSISSVGGIVLVGNRLAGAGVDNALGLGSDGIVHYGPGDAIRSTAPYIAGNYATDCLNNAYELSGTDGAVVEFNKSFSVGGHSIVEMYSTNSNAVVRYNRGEFSSTAGRIQTAYGAAGIYFGNYYWNGSTWAANDTSNAKNSANKAYFNLIINPGKAMFQAYGGTGHVCQHNTGYADHDLLYGAGNSTNLPAGLFLSGTAAAGFLNFSNNMLFWAATTGAFTNPAMINISSGLGSANCVPIGDKNCYFNTTGNSTAAFKYGPSTTSLTTYKSAVASYSLDQNSYSNSLTSGGNLSAAALGFNTTTFRPLAAAVPGLTTLTGIGSMYQDGQPYAPASATIGALKGA